MYSHYNILQIDYALHLHAGADMKVHIQLLAKTNPFAITSNTASKSHQSHLRFNKGKQTNQENNSFLQQTKCMLSIS